MKSMIKLSNGGALSINEFFMNYENAAEPLMAPHKMELINQHYITVDPCLMGKNFTM